MTFSPVATMRSESLVEKSPATATSARLSSSAVCRSSMRLAVSVRSGPSGRPSSIAWCFSTMAATVTDMPPRSPLAAWRPASSNRLVTPDAAETTTARGAGWAAAMAAASRTRSSEPTEVPPNLRTIMRVDPDIKRGGSVCRSRLPVMLGSVARSDVSPSPGRRALGNHHGHHGDPQGRAGSGGSEHSTCHGFTITV